VTPSVAAPGDTNPSDATEPLPFKSQIGAPYYLITVPLPLDQEAL